MLLWGGDLVICKILVASLGKFLARAFLYVAQVLYVLVANSGTSGMKKQNFLSLKPTCSKTRLA